MKKYLDPSKDQWEELLRRPAEKTEEIEKTVLEIFQEVKTKGDEAILRYTELFDGHRPDRLQASEEEVKAAGKEVSEELKSAIELAKKNISAFHAAQATEKVKVETTAGVECWQQKKPIQKVGLYIPGGTAPLFSTVLMLAVPAAIAGCKEVVLCTPPGRDGKIDPAILYTAELCGISKIYKIGGIQAIAAMTFGSATVDRVFKIFGPGNQYVTVAKQMATKYNVAIDMPAGPSELLVLADDSANPAFVASDLLSQAEHGPDSQVILVTLDQDFLDRVEQEVVEQVKRLPRREIAGAAIKNSRSIFFSSKEKALDLINDYAPEHLIICAKEEAYFVERVENAGSVFIGNNTPESAGDYASGTNHTLPTNGYAKQYSGVNLDSFLKTISYQRISEEGLKNIGPAIELMAAAEGLEAHKNAVSLRLEELSKK